MAHRQYPNPAAIVYPTTQPPRFAPQLTSQAGGSYPLHTHCAFVDKSGNGATDTDASHFHYVRNGRIDPDPSDGHTHTFVGLPCGAGAVLPMPTQGQAGPLGATPPVTQVLAARRAQTRMNTAAQALDAGNCRVATAAIADAGLWLQTRMKLRMMQQQAPQDLIGRQLLLALVRLRVQAQRRCS